MDEQQQRRTIQDALDSLEPDERTRVIRFAHQNGISIEQAIIELVRLRLDQIDGSDRNARRGH